MSLDKAIQSGKEHRKPYRKAKAVSSVCRRNQCPFCLGNDLYNNKKREQSANSKMEEG